MPGKKKKVEARELIETKVEFVSFVRSPANDKEFKFVKNAEGGIIEDECITAGLENNSNVELDKDKKENKSTEKKSFKQHVLKLLGIEKNENNKKSKNIFDKEDMNFFEVKEEKEMSEFTDKVLKSLDRIEKRVVTLEQGVITQDSIDAQIVEMKKELESKEGTEKLKLSEKIESMESLSLVKKGISKLENEIKNINIKLENDGLDESDADVLKGQITDKEMILSMLKENEAKIKETLPTAKSETAADKTGGEAGDVNKSELTAVMDKFEKIGKRLEDIENVRTPSNKITLEIDKNTLEAKETDYTKSEFWDNLIKV